MIQRIQSLYLLVAAALVAVMFFTPLAWFADASSRIEMGTFAVLDAEGARVLSTLYLGLLLLLAGGLSLVTIFLFRRRLLQIRLCVVSMVLLAGGAVMEGVYYYLCRRAFFGLEHMGEPLSGVRPAAVLPLVALLLVFLASRAILRDELLVRSADRIR